MDFLLRNLVIFAIAPCVGAWIEVIFRYGDRSRKA